MAKTTTTISGHRFTDYTLDDLRAEARSLAKCKGFTLSGNPAKFSKGFILRVTENGAQLVIQGDGSNGEIERGTVL